jgi:hypothetical protein
MKRRRQYGGNFKGNQRQRSKKQSGGNILKNIKNHQITKTVTKKLMNLGRQLGSKILETPPKQLHKAMSGQRVQQGAGIGYATRRGPHKRIKNTIPKTYMYHQ